MEKAIEKSVIITLDLGTMTGWAARKSDGSIVSGVVNLKPRRFDGGGMRFLKFRRWLDEMFIKYSPIYSLFFEEVRAHKGVDAAHVYGGLLAVLTAWCEENNIPYQGVGVGAIKKHITGKGQASKDEVIKAIEAKGHAPKDHNEADALALLYYSI